MGLVTWVVISFAKLFPGSTYPFPEHGYLSYIACDRHERLGPLFCTLCMLTVTIVLGRLSFIIGRVFEWIIDN